MKGDRGQRNHIQHKGQTAGILRIRTRLEATDFQMRNLDKTNHIYKYKTVVDVSIEIILARWWGSKVGLLDLIFYFLVCLYMVFGGASRAHRSNDYSKTPFGCLVPQQMLYFLFWFRRCAYVFKETTVRATRNSSGTQYTSRTLHLIIVSRSPLHTAVCTFSGIIMGTQPFCGGLSQTRVRCF